MSAYEFTSESICEGHPDKVCDAIADAVLDACLEKDPHSHVACEVLCKDRHVVLAGEITTAAHSDYVSIARKTIEDIGYIDESEPFCAKTVEVRSLLSRQSQEIAQGVDTADQGAGDQGIMFGFATDETPELMPLPILLAHRLARGMADDRKAGREPWLRPDGKTQVTVRYNEGRPVEVTTILVSAQHRAEMSRDGIRAYVAERLGPRVLGSWWNSGIQLHVNPTGSFILGGPSADCGVTGRKIICDTYGGAARHGGGAFSGKDPSKVDRSAAYFCRFAARQVVLKGLVHKAEIQVSYAIGEAKPLSVFVETFGTGDGDAAAAYVAKEFDFRPAAIIERLGLLKPIYRWTTNYGHFGKPDLPWEA